MTESAGGRGCDITFGAGQAAEVGQRTAEPVVGAGLPADVPGPLRGGQRDVEHGHPLVPVAAPVVRLTLTPVGERE